MPKQVPDQFTFEANVQRRRYNWHTLEIGKIYGFKRPEDFTVTNKSLRTQAYTWGTLNGFAVTTGVSEHDPDTVYIQFNEKEETV